MNKYLQKIENKKIWCCDFFSTRINLQEPYLSLCHDTFVGQRKIGFLDGFTPKKYYEALMAIADDNERPNAHCRKCAKCKQQIYQFKKLNWVTINTSWYCNSSCIYCMGHFASPNDGKDVMGIISDFYKENLFERDCLFDWGGGEPTLNPIFDDTSSWITEHNYLQRINTNGIIYSKTVEYALKSDRTSLRISLDSGTRECFEKVKGTRYYDDVWNNIREYRKYSDNIFIKYNVFNLNCDRKEIDMFLHMCKDAEIRHIIIDAEVKSYQPEKNCGPFYYTEDAFHAMHYLEDSAKNKGFDVNISDYAFSYRPEYEDGKLMLPSVYYDNLDKDIISSNIYIETEPSVENLLKTIKLSDRKLIIRGFGKEGKMLLKILKNEGVSVSYISDQVFSNDCESELHFRSVNYFLEDIDLCNVILAGHCWKEMLKEINDHRKENFRVYYMNGLYFEKYLEEKGIK